MTDEQLLRIAHHLEMAARIVREARGVRAITKVRGIQEPLAGDVDINAAGLNYRARKGFRRAGITTLNQAKDWTDCELRSLRGVGEETIRNIRQAMANHGILPIQEN